MKLIAGILYICFILSATQGSDIQQLMFDKMKTYKHFAVQNEVAEKEYLRYLIRVLLPYLLPPNARECRYVKCFGQIVGLKDLVF